MAFTAKLKKTGEYFDAHTDLGSEKDRDLIAALPIVDSHYYEGRFYPGSYSLSSDPNGADRGKYSGFSEAVLPGAELEPVYPPSKLFGTRKVNKAEAEDES